MSELGKYSEMFTEIRLSGLVAAYVAKFVLCKLNPFRVESVTGLTWRIHCRRKRETFVVRANNPLLIYKLNTQLLAKSLSDG